MAPEQVNGIDGEVLQRLTRLETKMDMIISVKDTAIESHASAKSAHKRIDDMEKDVDDFKNKVDKIVFWASTTVIGGIIIGAINLLFAFAKK